MDDPHLTRPRPRKDSLAPAVNSAQNLARASALPWVAVVVLLALVGWLSWKAFFAREEGDAVTSAMLAFEKQNSLVVLTSRFQIVAQSMNTKSILGVPVIESNQAMIVPASVDYRIDLSRVDRDRLSWDGESKTLSVRLPPLRISEPNIREGKAIFFEDGLFVSSSSSRSLSTNNSRQAERKAIAFAKNPEILGIARAAAKDAIRQNLAIPLQVAGYGDVKVNVRFDGEAG